MSAINKEQTKRYKKLPKSNQTETKIKQKINLSKKHKIAILCLLGCLCIASIVSLVLAILL